MIHSGSMVVSIISSKFPPDVLSDESLMCILAVCGSRIEHMQVGIRSLMYVAKGITCLDGIAKVYSVKFQQS